MRRPTLPTAASSPPRGPTSGAGEARRPNLRVVSDNPWNDPRSYAPDLLEALARNERRLRDRPSWRDELAADWRDFLSEIRRSPYSHLLVAIAAVTLWSLLLILPLLLGGAR
jgi:hypothetical protein